MLRPSNKSDGGVAVATTLMLGAAFLLAGCFVLTGCSGQPLSTREKGDVGWWRARCRRRGNSRRRGGPSGRRCGDRRRARGGHRLRGRQFAAESGSHLAASSRVKSNISNARSRASAARFNSFRATRAPNEWMKVVAAAVSGDTRHEASNGVCS